MSAHKRKSTASPPPTSSANNDDQAQLEIAPSETIEPPRKRPNLISAKHLCQLPLDILEPLLPLQKRCCLQKLVGCLPPIPIEACQPVPSTSTLTADDDDAAVFTDRSDRGVIDQRTRLHASSCVGLEEEWHTLHGMLNATVTAQESNSCLLIGASGSGKSLLVDSVLRSISDGKDRPYYHVHLAGSVQINDRSAMKEMAQQLILQGAFSEQDVGEALDDEPLEDEDPSSTLAPGVDHVFGGDAEDEDEAEEIATAAAAAAADEQAEIQDELAGAILSSLNNIIAHIIALLSNTASTGTRKPLVITLDDFDLFTARPRQALLYCLLDAVQAASYGAGLAVVGLTSRVDTVDLLEKRVKSRFSHRILHVRPPASYGVFERIVRNAFSSMDGADGLAIPAKDREAFVTAWKSDVDVLFGDVQVQEMMRGVYELSNDVRMVYRILTPVVSQLTLVEPTFNLDVLLSTATVETTTSILSTTRDLTDPELALLISIKHLQTRDRTTFNFEMCYDELRRFAARDARERMSNSTANQASAVSTPFYADRKIALMSFHSLLSLELVLPETAVSGLSFTNPTAKPSAAAPARTGQNTIRKEFWKVRCVLSPNIIVQAVKDRNRQVAVSSALVKWASSHG